jgi:hypothetical protein
MAREAFEQLLAEDENLGGFVDYRGRQHVSIGGRPRASGEDGLCERDILSIVHAGRETGPPGGSTIVEIKSERWFYVLADDKGQPRWDLRAEPLDRACAAVHPGESAWFTATTADAAVSAVAGLIALKAEMARPGSRMIEQRCRPASGCPDLARLAALIDPLEPSGAWLRPGRDCPDDRWCVEVLLDHPGCGGWSTLLRMDPVDTRRFRSARIGAFVGALHCGEEAAEREMEALDDPPE